MATHLELFDHWFAQSGEALERRMRGIPDEITLRRPDDFHLHVRQDEMLRDVLPYTTLWCGRAMIMPNIKPPVLTGNDAINYYNAIKAVQDSIPGAEDFTPLMTIQITPFTRREDLLSAVYDANVVAGKVYPKGMTTNSENGVEDYEALYGIFEEMESQGMVLSLHGEHPGKDVYCLDREFHFLKILEKIIQRFPKLKIVLEHVTTEAAINTVTWAPETVAATITVHHLFLTLNDVIGGMLRPHYFCKPVAKRSEDRYALLQAALSGNPKFFLGTDSAPHLKGAKECDSGCAGIFTAPVALSLLTSIFEQNGNFDHGKVEDLENFTSVFGARFYGLPPNNKKITLCRDFWTVPKEMNGIIPFFAGLTLPWRIKN